MELILALAFGLNIGSFLNVCIARLPMDQSVVMPRSRCPTCTKRIAWYDTLPILSYLILNARCRNCNAAISARYPLVEAFTGMLSVLLVLDHGLSIQWCLSLAFCSALIVLIAIDLYHRILPDVITLNGIWIGLIVSVYLSLPSPFVLRLYHGLGVQVTDPRVVALTSSIMGLVLGGGLLWLVREAFFWIRRVEGMGYGDIKMMAMVGAFLGPPLTLLTILLGSLIGSVTGLAVIGMSGKSRNYELPFGTFLGMAAVIAVVYGNDLISLYWEYAFPHPA